MKFVMHIPFFILIVNSMIQEIEVCNNVDEFL